MGRWRLLAFFILLRIVNALLVDTFFQPDEFYQALEVAHRLVFGYGYLTWEWREAVRSALHPMLFALVYKVLGITGLDNAELVSSGEGQNPAKLLGHCCAKNYARHYRRLRGLLHGPCSAGRLRPICRDICGR